MGGGLTVESAGIGKGCTFTATWDLLETNDTVLDGRPATPESRPTSKRVRGDSPSPAVAGGDHAFAPDAGGGSSLWASDKGGDVENPPHLHGDGRISATRETNTGDTSSNRPPTEKRTRKLRVLAADDDLLCRRAAAVASSARARGGLLLSTARVSVSL